MLEKILEFKAAEFEEKFQGVFGEIEYFLEVFKEFENEKWIEIPNKNLYFNREIMACYPNFLNNFQELKGSSDDKYYNIKKRVNENKEYGRYGIEWDIQTYPESINSFYGKNHPMQSHNNHNIQSWWGIIYREKNEIYWYDNRPGQAEKNQTGSGLIIPIFRLGDSKHHEEFNGKDIKFNYTPERILYIFLKNNLIPSFVMEDKSLKNRYEVLVEAIAEIEEIVELKKIVGNKIIVDEDRIKTLLANMDRDRVNIDRYDDSLICDPNGGHWDLYENNPELYLKGIIGIKNIYMRDPRFDIKRGGVVGIDFGTKSTVVVYQDDKNITLPMRISGGILNKKVESNDFENPTVIEFNDIDSFIENYKNRMGRPITKWNDVTVSHTAFSNLVGGDTKSFYSIISELKQWAGSKKDRLLIKDRKGVEKVLKPYSELSSEDIDPIEIYAYYIGSYINNMRNGIYLEYYLSFPVTYEKDIRERILSSFVKGIKKSLPKVILEDENVMKKFKVKHGANEPAAYAVCALQEYGFEPEDDEKIFYGVFDFGGGTLDFDFGIFKETDDDRYDYELEHFGAGGDRYLGGENILRELAFEIFKENMDTLRDKGITFVCPEWCDRFIGDETLVDNNGNSKLNMKIMMEKLREFWEGKDELEEILKTNLFNKNAEPVTVELNVDVDRLKDIVYSKIEGGIKNFFIAMDKAFKNEDSDKIYILLAGNSCKHPLVKEIFEEYIESRDIEILPALGTEEAYSELEERGIEIDREDKRKPTGKTGVAYGLLESTSDSCIKIINRDEEKNDEINFKYYLGFEKKKKLNPVLNPSIEYGNYYLFSYIKSDIFNIYYTTLPEASDGNFPIEKVKRVRVGLESDYDSDTKIYLKPIGPDTVEYIISKKDITEKEFLESGKVVLD